MKNDDKLGVAQEISKIWADCPDIYCTHCGLARIHRPPFNPDQERVGSYITCPHRKADNHKSLRAPYRDAFPEFSRICDHFAPSDYLKTKRYNNS